MEGAAASPRVATAACYPGEGAICRGRWVPAILAVSAALCLEERALAGPAEVEALPHALVVLVGQVESVFGEYSASMSAHVPRRPYCFLQEPPVIAPEVAPASCRLTPDFRICSLGSSGFRSQRMSFSNKDAPTVSSRRSAGLVVGRNLLGRGDNFISWKLTQLPASAADMLKPEPLTRLLLLGK